MEPGFSESRVDVGTDRREHICVAAFCLLAAVRVFVYSAAFPFFGNVDEREHFDTAVKYAQGDIPRQVELFSPETMRDIALYDSPFAMGGGNALEQLPPAWTLPAGQQAAWLATRSWPYNWFHM